LEESIIGLVQNKIAWARIVEALWVSWEASKPVLGRILLVMVGGSLGALTRYGTSLFAAQWFGTRFPWGTLLVNLVGCFLIGVSFALAERTNFMGPSARLFFMTGFLGALTTFSTFALETVNALRSGDLLIAVMNLLINNAIGFGLVVLGMWLVRLIRA
jgi:fluoride exporter